VVVSGDFMDFEELYDSLHEIVGEEGQYPSHISAAYRVLGVCYDIRHSLMGHREIEFVDNGMNKDKMHELSTITPEKNIYFTINVLWPEILFVTMVLNDFIYMSRKSCKYPHWDRAATTVRKFQTAVIECVKGTVSEPSFRRMMSLMNKDYTWFDYYATQYVDLLNIRFIEMDVEKRFKSIPTMAKRIAEKGDEYREVEGEVTDAAREHGCHMSDISLNVEYPDVIVW
jgi:hypothetical protein